MNILVYGSGKHARQLYGHLKRHKASECNVLGFIDDFRSPGEDVVDGLQTVGSLEEAARDKRYSPKRVRLFPAIGYGKMKERREAYEKAIGHGYGFEGFVHPRASVEESVHLGLGTVVLACAALDQDVRTGAFCFFDIGVLVSEECCFGDNNFCAAGATFGGRVRVSKDNFFGMGATVVDEVSVGEGNFFNACVLVYRDVEDSCKVAEPRDVRVIEGGEWKNSTTHP